MNVLFVDDDRDLLTQAKIYIEKKNEELELETAVSVDKALSKLDEKDFDVIVSDYQMPKKDGLEFLKIFREDKREDIPFIMFTGKGREEVAMEALNLGANRYLKKGGEMSSQYDLLVDAIRQEVNHHKTKKRYRELFHESPIGIWEEDFSEVKRKIDRLKDEGIEDIEGYIEDNPDFLKELMKDVEIISVNESVLDMYRADSLEDFRNGLSKIFGERSIPAFKEVVKKISKGETEYSTDKVDRRLDGEEVHVFLKWSVTAGHEDDYSSVLVSTVDITERKRKEERFKKYIENSPYGIFVEDDEGNYLEVNDKACEVTGYSREEMLDMKISDMYKQEDLKDVEEKFKTLKEEGKLRIELPFVRKDGSERIWDVYAINLSGDRSFSFVEDITEKKKMEEREDILHSLLRHDVANKNRILLGYLELLEEYDLPEETDNLIRKSKRAAEKSLNLIDKVSILRKAQHEKIEEVEICSIVEETVDQMRSRIEEAGMEIEMSCPEKGCLIKGGPLLNNVFSNLIENSIKHSEGNKIRVDGRIKDEKVICHVEDDGKGIPEDLQADIFEKEYTSDEERGTGLGLFLVKMLLDIYGGEINVKDSELGGAMFEVHLEKV